MKKRNLLIKAAGIALMVAIFAAAGVMTGHGKSPAGTAIKVQGAPKLTHSDKMSVLKKGAAVEEGDVITTGAGESVVLALATGDRIVVMPLSSLSVSSKDSGSASLKVDQKQGAMWAKVSKRGKGGAFEVKTPTAIAGVRGTAFSVSVKKDGGAGFCVCEGRIDIDAKNEKYKLKKGDGISVGDSKSADAPGPETLRNPSADTEYCLKCHQGGYSRDGMY